VRYLVGAAVVPEGQVIVGEVYLVGAAVAPERQIS
jgi:hypothetical protein